MNPLTFIRKLNETDPEMARREYITRNLLFFSFSITFSFSLITFILYLLGKMPFDTLLILVILSILLFGPCCSRKQDSGELPVSSSRC